ncbi:MAG: T9SS type A sorting domain-containing protein [Ignavibacteriales bacterium]|nr:T9SS type A sorting domain-containing protein [Ignavibacteriales bacterium]
MGMYKPQTGGIEYLGDQLDIMKDYGWHFAFWDWRRGPSADWNIEKFGDPDNLHWKRVLSEFHAPPVPKMISPANELVVPGNPTFTWDSMTAFTTYDIELSKVRGSRNDIFTITDIAEARYSIEENLLVDGETYSWRIRAKNPGGAPENISDWSQPQIFTVGPSQSLSGRTAVNTEYSLKQNYPNPFNPSTSISYSISENSIVKLTVYDMLGREVASLVNTQQMSGSYSAVFNASHLSSGVYIYRLDASPLNGKQGFSDIKRMILIK